MQGHARPVTLNILVTRRSFIETQWFSGFQETNSKTFCHSLSEVLIFFFVYFLPVLKLGDVIFSAEIPQPFHLETKIQNSGSFNSHALWFCNRPNCLEAVWDLFSQLWLKKLLKAKALYMPGSTMFGEMLAQETAYRSAY